MTRRRKRTWRFPSSCTSNNGRDGVRGLYPCARLCELHPHQRARLLDQTQRTVVQSIMKTQPQRSGVCSSRSSPELDAAILDEPEFQAASVDAWNEAALRRRAALAEVETRADNLPTYQGSCSDPYERGDRLIAIADIELELARSMARRLSAAAYHKPGPRLDVVKGEWLTAHRRRPLQPRCRTFGCTLPDLHAGLHQVFAVPFPAPAPAPAAPSKGRAPICTPLWQVASPMCKRRVTPRRWAGEVDVLRQKKVIGSAKRAAGSLPAACA